MTKSLIEQFISKERALLEAATPGPWNINASSTTTGRIWLDALDEGLYLSCKYPNQAWNMSNDCAFIANVRTSHAMALEMLEIANEKLNLLKLYVAANGDDWVKRESEEAIARIEKLAEKKP